jgi:hypothetical protein
MKPAAFNLAVLVALICWTLGVSILALEYGIASLAVFSDPFSESAFWRVGILLTTTGTVLAILLPRIRR